MSFIDVKSMKDDLFIEMLDVYIQSILYVRGVYPKGVFRKKKIFNTASYVSIHPDICSYLKNVLETARTLKRTNSLRSAQLILFCEEEVLFGTPKEEILEKYTFHVTADKNTMTDSTDELRQYVLKFEDQVRAGLILLNSNTKQLPALMSDSSSFRVHLDTNDKAFLELCERDKADPEVFIRFVAYILCSGQSNLTCILNVFAHSLKHFSWSPVDEDDGADDADDMDTWGIVPIAVTDMFRVIAHANLKQDSQ